MFSVLMVVRRKMLKNKWLVASLLVGISIGTALLSCISTYTNGILQKMLIKEFQQYQQDYGKYPGGMLIGYDLSRYMGSSSSEVYNIINKYSEKTPGIMPLPLVTESKHINTYNFRIAQFSDGSGIARNGTGFRLSAYYGLENHIKLVDGKLPDEDTSDRVYEGLVTEESLKKLDLVVGKEYSIAGLVNEGKELFRIRIAGVFTPASDNDPYWYNHLSNHDMDIFINYESLLDDFVLKDELVSCKMEWYYCFDYNSVKLESINHVLSADRRITNDIREIGGDSISLRYPVYSIAESFFVKKQKILTMMLSINIPVLVMLWLFIFMVSLLKTEREKTEISVLISRGIGRGHVTMMYAVEGLILAVLAMIAGPPIGLFLSRIIGASNGFLDFVNRSAIDVKLHMSSYIYAFWGVIFSVIMLTVPAYLSTGTSIVARKRSITRRSRVSFWQKIMLDVILISVSCYGIYTFNSRQATLAETGLTAESLEIDPLLFIVPALFLIGMGLLFLRLFPFVIDLVFRLGKRFWPPPVYAVLLQVSRSIVQYHFIMLFISVTVALGLFSANAATILNRNAQEKIMYRTAADIVIEPVWEVYEGFTSTSGSSGIPSGINEGSSTGASPVYSSSSARSYIEPDYKQFEELYGVEAITKVYSTDRSKVIVNNKNFNTTLMGINTEEFGKIAWFRHDLLPHHWYDYLNLIAQDQASVLISSSLAEEAGLKPGDMINLKWGDTGRAPFLVYGIIDYWPSWNPNATPMQKLEDGEIEIVYGTSPKLVVGNIHYIQNNMSVEPYNIWIKLAPGVKTSEFYKDIEDKHVKIAGITNMKDELIELKNDPFRMGINGALTLGFLISAIISLLGFILYWTLSIHARELQFGIFRAMGMYFKELLGMLTWEQFFTSGMAVAVGIIAGRLSSRIFIPFFQLSYSSYEQVPPFRMVFDAGDQMKIYILVGVMLATGLAVLGFLVSRIRTAQALKLGED